MKKKKILVVFLMLLIISIVISNIFSNNYSVKKNDITYDNEMFAYMLEECNGSNCEYKESKTNAWPSMAYIYNPSLSMCIDAKGNSLTGILSYDKNLNVAKLTNTKSSTYCVLYFDKDDEKPVIEDFYVNNSDGYVASKDVSGYVTWEDDDVVEYCINTTNSTSGCSWKSTTGKKVDYTYDIGNGTGEKTLYAFIKDVAGNISDSKSYKLNQDTGRPVITTFTITNTNGYVTSQNVGGSITWNDNDVVEYCINTTNSTSGCSWKSTTGKKVDYTYDIGNGTGEKTLYAFIKDVAGNISDSKNYTVKQDTSKPVIQNFSLDNIDGFTNKTKDTGSITWNDNDVVSYCVTATNNSSSCTWSNVSGKKADFTYDLGSQGEKTLYAFIKDNVGLVSDVKSFKITLDTEGPVVTIVETQGYCESTAWVVSNITDNYSGIKSYTISGKDVYGKDILATKEDTTYSKNLTNYAISLGDLTHVNTQVEVYATDRLGNKSSVVSAYVSLPWGCGVDPWLDPCLFYDWKC